MNNKSLLKHLDFLIIDVIVLITCFIVAYLIKLGNIDSLYNSIEYRTLLFVVLCISFSVSYFIEPYKDILKRSWVKELKELLVFVTYSFLILSFFLVVTKTSETFSRIFTVLFYLVYLVCAFTCRVTWKKILYSKVDSQVTNNSNTRILVITTKKELEKVINDIKKKNFDLFGIDSICVIDEDLKGQTIDRYEIKTNKDDVLSYLCHNWVDEVLIATQSEKVPIEIYKGLSQAGITTSIITKSIEGFEDRKHYVNKLFGYTVIQSSIAYRTKQQIFIKRLMDICGGIVGSLITIILTLFIGPIIYIKSPGPIFYKQERIGLNGRRFYMYKFRSMIMNADAMKKDLMAQNRIKDGMMFKMENDPRIIPGIGNFIRKTSLDEFPQFFNVLLGDMSLVGTRPPTVDEWVKYKLEHRIRMSIKPGITGMWQINGRSKIVDFNKVIEYDTQYINNWTLSLDIEILFKTALVLLSKREDEAM